VLGNDFETNETRTDGQAYSRPMDRNVQGFRSVRKTNMEHININDKSYTAKAT